MTHPTTPYATEIRALIAEHGLYAERVEKRLGEMVAELLEQLGDHPEAVATALEAAGYTDHDDDPDKLRSNNPVVSYLRDQLKPVNITVDTGGVWIDFWTPESDVDSQDSDWYEPPRPVLDYLSDLEESVLAADEALASIERLHPKLALRYGPIPTEFLFDYDRVHAGRPGWYLHECGTPADHDPELPPYWMDPTAGEMREGWDREYLNQKAWSMLDTFVEDQAARYTAADVKVTGWKVAARNEAGDVVVVVPTLVTVRRHLELHFGPGDLLVLRGLSAVNAKRVLDAQWSDDTAVVRIPDGPSSVGTRTLHVAPQQARHIREDVVETPVALGDLVGDREADRELLDCMLSIAEKAGMPQDAGIEWKLWSELAVWREADGDVPSSVNGVDISVHMHELDALQKAADGWVWYLDVEEPGYRFVSTDRWLRIRSEAGHLAAERGLLVDVSNAYLDARVH